MSDIKPDALDRALASLPREVEPARDLWPGIAEQLAPAAQSSADRLAFEPSDFLAEKARRSGRKMAVLQRVPASFYRLAAALVLVVATAATTYFVSRESLQREAAQQVASEPAVPANFGNEPLGAEYLQARATLNAGLDRRLAALPPDVRAGIERSLADLRRAADEISAQLAAHPDHPLLQELLLSAYQGELAVLADVNQLTAATLEQPI